MDLKKIFDEIEKVDPEVYSKLDSRRGILKSFGSKVAVAALPIALGSMFKKAYGKTSDTVVDVLNFALTLEYLEYNFYHQGNNTATLMIPTTDQPSFQTIEGHELEHVNFLISTITSLGGTPYTPSHYTAGNPYSPLTYDFTAGGTFPTVFTNYATFLDVSQTFEDTGVRAYKGQASALQTNLDVLTAALQIHSVEARHASHIRYIRRLSGATDTNSLVPKPWITGGVAPANAVAANYAGEDNTVQLSVNILTLPAASGTTSTNTATEAFDEPLTMSEVVTLVTPFLVS